MAVLVLTWVKLKYTPPSLSKAVIIEILGTTYFLAYELVLPCNFHLLLMNCVSPIQVSSTLMILFPFFIKSMSFIPNLYLKHRFCSELPLNGIYFTLLYFNPKLCRNILYTKEFSTFNPCFYLTKCFIWDDLWMMFPFSIYLLVSSSTLLLHSFFQSSFSCNSFRNFPFFLLFYTKLPTNLGFTHIISATSSWLFNCTVTKWTILIFSSNVN